MFQFPGFAFVSYVFRNKYLHMTPVSPKTYIPYNILSGLCPGSKILGITEIEGGFPHSEICGSKVVRTSPQLIAAYHVLHRLSAPRHPPDTLIALDRSHYQYPPPEGPRQRPSERAEPKFSKDTIEKTSFASNMPGNVRSGDVHLVN